MTRNDEKFSRRSMLRRTAGLFGIVGLSALAAACGPRAEPPPPPPPPAPPPQPAPPPPAPMPPPAPVRQSKKEARYQSRPHGRERCAGCVHFQAPKACEIVEGRVSPRGWCTHFEGKA